VSGGDSHSNPRLRERFTGRPEFVENFFEFIAEEVREYLALLGARTLDEVIGDATRLSITSTDDVNSDLDSRRCWSPSHLNQRHQSVKQEHGLDGALDWIFLHEQ